MDLGKQFESAGVRKITTKGDTATITFGTNDIRRNKWDGEYPVEIWKCWEYFEARDGVKTRESLERRSLKSTTLKRGVNAVARGWMAGAKEQWVELRTPADRVVQTEEPK